MSRLESRLRRSWRRRETRRSADEGLCRRILPRMRQFYYGPQRHVLEVRHLRRHDGVPLKGNVSLRDRGLSWPSPTCFGLADIDPFGRPAWPLTA
jgi:hypothetical protein